MCFSQFTVLTCEGWNQLCDAALFFSPTLPAASMWVAGILSRAVGIWLYPGPGSQDTRPSPCQTVIPGAKCCRLLWGERVVGPFEPISSPSASSSTERTRLNKVPTNCGQTATGSLYPTDRHKAVRAQKKHISEHTETLEPWAEDAEPSPTRQQKGPAKGDRAQQVQHRDAASLEAP